MIRYERFTKRYARQTAVAALDLELREGETLALVGPNGSGKTTTLKAALGLVRPTEGRVSVDGHDAATARARARVGYLPQRLAFPEGATARETLGFYARLRGSPSREVPANLHRVGLAAEADRAVDGFSGGMLQRLGIAVALLGNPRVLVLDEPSAALDPTGSLDVRDILRDIRRDGTTVLLSSHDLVEVAALADRVAIFVAGELRALGDPATLLTGFGIAAVVPPGSSPIETLYRAVTAPQRRIA